MGDSAAIIATAEADIARYAAKKQTQRDAMGNLQAQCDVLAAKLASTAEETARCRAAHAAVEQKVRLRSCVAGA